MSWAKKLARRIVGGGSCCSHAAGTCCPQTDPGEVIKEAVKKNYAELITTAGTGCCGSTGTIEQLAGYTDEQLEGLPDGVRETTFACGNPVAFAEMKKGEVVLDIGSGAGLDALLAAKKVGPNGKVIGLDMTPEMIEAARANARRAGVENVEFRRGDAEQMPVDDGSCDWIISNCVINLAPNKRKVFGEAYRVLRPGGRLLVSDIVTHGLPAEIRQDMAAWAGCIGGAPEEQEYLDTIQAAGFRQVEIAEKLTYDEDTIRAMSGECCSPEGAGDVASALAERAPQLAGRVSSVRISAVKPSREE